MEEDDPNHKATDPKTDFVYLRGGGGVRARGYNAARIVEGGIEYTPEAWALKKQNEKLDRIIALLEQIAEQLSC